MERLAKVRVTFAAGQPAEHQMIETHCEAEADAIVQALAFAALTNENAIGVECVTVTPVEVRK